MRFLEEGRERGARHVVVDPRRTATAELAHTHLQPLPNTDLSLANGLLHIAIRENLVDEEYVAARTNGFDAVRRAVRSYWPDRVERITGIAGDRPVRPGPRAGRRTRGDDPDRARGRAARRRHGHHAGVDQPRARARPARARSGQRLGDDHRAGQRAGRARARAEGRPAARVPLAEEPGRTARTSPRSGASTRTSCPARASRPTSCSTAWAPRRRADAAGQRLEPGGERAERAPRREAAAARWTSWPSPTSSCPRPPQLADVVLPTTQWAEESGTMTNPEGRVLLRRRAVDPPPERAQRPADLAGDRGPARAGAVLPDRPRGGLRPSCGGPARAGSPTTPASPTSAWPRARRSSGRARPRTTPAPRACSSTASPPRTGAPTSSRSGPRLAAELPDDGAPVPADHRPGPVAVPVGHADPAQPDARRGRPAPVRRAAPRAGPPARHRRRRPGAPGHPAGQRGARRPARPRHPAGHGVRAVPLGRRGLRQRPDQRRARPDVADARVQDLPGRRREGGLPIEQNGVAAQVAIRT